MKQSQPQSPSRQRVKLALLALAIVVIVLLARSVFTGGGGTSVVQLDLSAFQRQLDAHGVHDATIREGSHSVVGTLANGVHYEADYPAGYEEKITAAILDKVGDVKVEKPSSSLWLGLALQFLPFIFMFALIWWFLRSIANGSRASGFGKSKARMLNRDRPTVKFSDVAGLDEAVEELGEVAEFLADPQRFQDVGARIPRGVLLIGPPGTGKTLLAKAIAGEAGVPFFTISGSNFVEMYVGVGAARVRDLFAQAKASAPAIVFIDEIDAVGRERGAGVGGGNDEREQTLNQLLVEMDGFDGNTGVILVAATNRPDVLDSALLRPGRFDRQVVVDRPDLAGRRAILAVHTRGKPFADGVDLDVIARRTPGFTGADLANLVNEAALLAARRGFTSIGMPQLEEASERVLAGPERKARLISDAEKRVIAYHEGGHALVSHALPGTDPVHKVSIIPRGQALGYTLTLPTEDRFLVRRSELVDELAMLLGGRAAEELVFGDPTTGAQNDIDRATAVARQMVTEFGMSEVLGPVHLSRTRGQVFLGRDVTTAPELSDDVASSIDNEVRAFIEIAHAEARSILIANRDVLDAIADALIDQETLDAASAAAILSEARPYERTIVLPGATARPAGAVAASDVSRTTTKRIP
jgi:cell division protease FtsH